VALSSITVKLGQQQQAEGLLKYMSSHGQHVDSMELEVATLEGASGVCVTSRSRRVSLHQLPDHLQLSSLVLSHLQLQLQPGARFQGVVRPGLPVKQLQLSHCLLLDGPEGLAAALSLLPGLQHLSIRHCYNRAKGA
jgi:hypothetical protein